MTAAASDPVGSESIRIERSVAVDPERLWPWLTDSEKTAQWIGPWHYVDQRAGQIGMQLVAEEGTPASAATIHRCEAPRVLELTTEDTAGSWHLQVSLEAPGDASGETLLVFEHFDVPTAMLADVTAGWNFYLDTMLAAKDGLEKPVFEDYLTSAPAEAEPADTAPVEPAPAEVPPTDV